MLQKLLRIAIRSSSKSPTVSPTPKSLLWTYPLNLKNRLSAQHIPLPFHLAYLAEHFVNHSPDFDYHCTALAFVHNRQDY